MEKIIYLLFLLHILVSCKKENKFDCIKSNGKITTETRSLTSFKGIEITDHIHVTFIQASEKKIVITAGKNIIPLIKCDIIDDTLYISNENKCNFVRSYKPQINIDFYIDTITRINLNYATGNITSKDTLVCANFKLYAHSSSCNLSLKIKANKGRIINQGGASDFSISGIIYDEYAISHIGNGTCDASRLISKKTATYSSGIGDLKVYSSEYLYTSINGRGNTYYYGNPDLVQSFITGSGKLIKE